MRVRRLLQGLFGMAGLLIGFSVGSDLWPAVRALWIIPHLPLHLLMDGVGAVIGGLLGLGIGRVIEAWEAAFRGWLFGRLTHVSAVDAMAGAGGTLIGLGAGALLSVPASSLPDVGAFLPSWLSGLRSCSDMPAFWAGSGYANSFRVSKASAATRETPRRHPRCLTPA